MSPTDVRELLEQHQGELLLQSVALKVLFRHLPAAREDLRTYIDAANAGGDFDELDKIVREAFLSAADSLTGKR